MSKGQEPADTAPACGSYARTYPSDNGKMVGPIFVGNSFSTIVNVSVIEGSGDLGSYQPEGADRLEGPWYVTSSAIVSSGSHDAAGPTWTFLRVRPIVLPNADTVVRVEIRLIAAGPQGL